MTYLTSYRTYFYAAFILLLAFPVFGKQPDIRFINLLKEDGLSNNTINDIVKDKLGFIWIGTMDGLCRYEGANQMKIFNKNPEDSNQLQSNYIRSLLSDKNGNLWIGTKLGGLTRYHQETDTWTTFRYSSKDESSLSNDEVLSLFEDSKGRIWVGTEDGLNLFEPETETFTSFKVDKSTTSALQGKAILTIGEDHRGFIWIGTWAGGLHLLLPNKQDIKKSTFRNILPSSQKGSHNIWKIYQDKDQRMWIGSHGKGLFLMQLPHTVSNLEEQQNWTPSFLNYNKHGNPNKEIQDIYQDHEKNLWLATSDGLNYIPASDLQQLDKVKNTDTNPPLHFYKYQSDTRNNRTLANNIVTKIFQDEQHLLWFGTSSGISIYNWQIHQLEFTELPISENYEFYDNNFHFTKRGELFIGSFDKGIIKYETTNHTFQTLLDNNQSSITNEPIQYLYSSNDNDYFIGTSIGIIHFDKSTATSTSFPVPDWLKNDINGFHLRYIYKEDGKNRLWVGGPLGLFLINLDNGVYTHFEHEPHNPNSISDNSINYILKDSYGDIWIATYNGLNRIDKKQLVSHDLKNLTFQQYKVNGNKGGIASNNLTVLKEMGDQLYIGTTNGLLAYNYLNDNFISYQDQGCKSWIQAIQSTKSGNLWCSTKEGILNFNPSTLYLNIFEKQNEIEEIEFRHGSSFTDQAGFIYFSCEKGFIKFHPTSIKENKVAPPIYITCVKKMNPEGVSEVGMINKKELTLANNDYYLGLQFSAVNYNQPNKNKYAYMLEGFDESWIYTSSANLIVYTNLAPGQYVFKIKAANNDGYWNEEETILKINKQFAFWQTKTFYTLLLLSLLGLIGLSFLFYSKYLHQHYRAIEEYNTKLNNEIVERKKVEKVLHSKNLELSRSNHDLEQFAYIASHDLQAPLRTIRSFAGLLEKSMPDKMSNREKEFFGYITNSVTNMQELVNDLLTFSRVNTRKREIQQVDLSQLMGNILLELDTTLKEAKAEVQLADFPESIQADKIKLKQLLQNLISNGIKFSKEGSKPVVQVSCKEKDTCWQFEVKDNGIGISEEFNGKIFQLFQRLHTSSEYAGTGIGLALCKKIVEQHDGEIYVDSEVGKGSNFVFTISRMLN